MTDMLSHGRVVFGVGRGYHTRKVERFGAPLLDQNASRELFDIVFKALNNESFAHKGQALHAAARGALSRLYFEGTNARAASGSPAGRMLAADPERLGTGVRFHGQTRHPRCYRWQFG